MDMVAHSHPCDRDTRASCPSHWATRYIGDEWTPEHDCWDFFRRVQWAEFSREVPGEGYDVGSALSCAHALKLGRQSPCWKPVTEPREGDAVLMGKSRQPSHIGIWVDVDGGGILHCQRKSGVVFTSINAAASCGWGHVEYYRYAP